MSAVPDKLEGVRRELETVCARLLELVDKGRAPARRGDVVSYPGRPGDGGPWPELDDVAGLAGGRTWEAPIELEMEGP